MEATVGLNRCYAIYFMHQTNLYGTWVLDDTIWGTLISMAMTEDI